MAVFGDIQDDVGSVFRACGIRLKLFKILEFFEQTQEN